MFKGEAVKNSYNQFSEGDHLSFFLQTLEPDGLEFSPEESVVEDIKGGGFFGKVIIPEDKPYVIKTSIPDSWHHLWRHVNWGFKPLPAQVSETAAQLEHLSTRLIHKVLPVLSNGEFYSPDSLGYTRFPTGFAQVVEKVNGRGPRYDQDKDEFSEFKEAQRQLLKLGLSLGLEQVGQIHPDNPFGMANLWRDEQNQRWVWMDTIPAIPHNGLIYPLFHFRFHGDLRRWFYQKQATFNRIHTGYFLSEIAKNKHLFSDEEFQAIKSELILYEELWQEHKKAQRDQETELKPAIYALGNTLLSVAPKIGEALIKTPVNLVRMFIDPKYRRGFVLKGIDEAKKQGLISEEEWKMACDSVELTSKEGHVLGGLLAYNFATSRILDIIEYSSYGAAFLGEDKLQMAALGFFTGWVLPSIIRPGSAIVAGLATNLDLKTATKFSLIPKAGGMLGPIAQLSGAGEGSEQVLHYAIRHYIAMLSKLINPAGGWSTELEAKLWKLIGAPLERIGKKTK